jgi:hypothetical protein
MAASKVARSAVRLSAKALATASSGDSAWLAESACVFSAADRSCAAAVMLVRLLVEIRAAASLVWESPISPVTPTSTATAEAITTADTTLMLTLRSANQLVLPQDPLSGEKKRFHCHFEVFLD